jgi:uncharacterized protein YyaL (SSP411 family)
LLRENSFSLQHRKSFLHDVHAPLVWPQVRDSLIIMNSTTLPARHLVAIGLCGLALVSISCRKRQPESAGGSGPAPVIVTDLGQNALASLPGAIYQSQAGSAIHWQPWTKLSLERAKAARRLVFCVIALPQQPGFQEVLASMEKSPGLAAKINDHYVPILVDGDASRELGILTADLSAEIRRPLQLPLFVWMTHEGNPVAWIPVSSADGSRVEELFNHSHTMVNEMWRDDLRLMDSEKKPSYVLGNSALDNANRRKRFEARKVSKVMSEQPAADVVRAIRQLASLYDTFSRNFDEAGGLFPASALELLATASVQPGLPADVRARSGETTRDLLKDLLPSAMFDPLDGGVFSSRRGASWALPSFVRDCPGQGRVAVALIEAYRATGNASALATALGVISFAEKNFATAEGLFAVGLAPPVDPTKWLWSIEEIEQILGAEDAAWWIKATAMKGLGNLPSEVDPRREFFRSNSLALGTTMEEIAAELGLPAASFAPRFAAAKAKLLAARDRRLGTATRDESSHAGASFRMVSAYAAAFAATGDEKFRAKAVALLTRSRDAFGVGPKLRIFSKDGPDSIVAGRAFLYALALQSIIDVAVITSDEQWLVWAEDLATTAAELFTGDGFLKECPDDAKLIDLPITDLVMLFDDSTAGLVSSVESRLAEIGRPLLRDFSELATPMPTYAVDRPILQTDLIMATVYRHYKVTLALGADLPPALKSASERLALRSIQRRPARPGDEVPTGSIKVIFADGESRLVASPESLQQAVLPSPGK